MKRAVLTFGLLFFVSACVTNSSRQTVSSGNDVWYLSASDEPPVLTISNTEKNQLFRQYAVLNNNDTAVAINCLFEAPTRLSFLAVLADGGEIWEMSYDPKAEPVFPGLVHNYRTGQVEGITVEEQPFARRRLNLNIDHHRLIFSPSHSEVIGYDANGSVVVYNLDSRKLAGRLSEPKEASLLHSRFMEIDNQLVFVLSLDNGKQRVFSAHNWRQVAVKNFDTRKLVIPKICTK